ncbi:oligosaccharide flippase family protein [Alphaproteobacteria bacterium]|nr:oligosaccharide flippase family protein [Alphaproteobacteria bacterium]
MKGFLTRDFFLNIGTYYIQLVVSLLVLIITTPLIINHLGEESYAVWSLLLSFIPFVLLLDLGLSTAVTQFIASNIKKLSRTELHQHLAAMAGVIALGFLFTVLAAVFASFNLDIFENQLIQKNKIGLALLVIGVSAALQLCLSFLIGVIYGHDKIVFVNMLHIIQQLMFFLGVVFFLKYFPSWSILCLSLGHIVGVLSALLIATILTWHARLIRASSFLEAPKQIHKLKKVMLFSFRIFIGNITSRILYNTDNIIIALIVGLVDLGKYDVAWKLCFYSTYLASAISYAMFPKLSNLFAQKNGKVLFFDSFLNVQQLSLAIGFSICIWLLFTWKTIIALWINEDFILSSEVFLCLLTMNLIHISSGPAGNALVAVGQNKEMMYCEVVNACLNLIFSVVLASYFGLVGVALGTLFAALLTSFWYVPLTLCRKIEIPISELVVRALPRPFVFALIMLSVAFWLFGDMSVAVELDLFILASICFGIVSVGLWLCLIKFDFQRLKR